MVGLSSCERGVDQCAHCCRVGLSSNSGSMTHILWYILDCLGGKMLGIPRNTINMAPPMSPRHMEVLWSLLFIFVVTFSLCPFSSCVPHSWGKNILGTNSCWKIAYRVCIAEGSHRSSSIPSRVARYLRGRRSRFGRIMFRYCTVKYKFWSSEVRA